MIPALALFFLSSFACAEGTPLYTLKDLSALEQEKNFEEFLAHVNDIRPSERGKLWKDMYQSMGMEMIDYKLKTRDFSLKSYKQVESIGRSNALSNDEFFQLKRSLYAKKFFGECYAQASAKKDEALKEGIKACDNELNSFWFFSKKDPDIGLELAALIEKYPSTLKTWPFYQRAVGDSIAQLYCEKPDVQRAIINKLTEESFDPEFDNNYKNLLSRFVPEKCFSKLVPALRLSLQSSVTNGLQKELAMSLLSAKGLLSKEEEDLYAVIYLLDGPVVGDKMNLAWKRVENLSANFKERQNVLAKIKNLPLVPDKIFKDPNLPRHKAIINLFAKNFPEFLNYYGESCVTYLENKSDISPNVSGSFQCHEFLKAAKASKDVDNTEWVSDSVQTKYSGLKR